MHKRMDISSNLLIINAKVSPKPDRYNMPAESLYDLKFPFSLYFMKQIHKFKRYYEEEIAMLRQDEDKVNRTTDELYDWVIEDHLKGFKNNVLTLVPQLKDSPLEQVPNYISMTLSLSLQHSLRIYASTPC